MHNIFLNTMGCFDEDVYSGLGVVAWMFTYLLCKFMICM